MTSRIIWKPLTFITEPQGGYVEVKRDHYWLTNDNGEVAFWKRGKGPLTPQCNRNQRITEHFLGGTEGATETLLVPLAFSPIRIEDYS